VTPVSNLNAPAYEETPVLRLFTMELKSAAEDQISAL